jgi:hypothetical protein
MTAFSLLLCIKTSREVNQDGSFFSVHELVTSLRKDSMSSRRLSESTGKTLGLQNVTVTTGIRVTQAAHPMHGSDGKNQALVTRPQRNMQTL